MPERDRGRKRRFPWWFDVFEEMEEMDEIIGEMMRRAFEIPSGMKSFGPYVYGFSVSLDPEGKPAIQQFGNVKPSRVGPQVKEEREPLVDVIDENDEVAVFSELPGVEKNDIRLHSNEKNLTISVDSKGRKYHKELELPHSVLPTSAKATYKNGVLEIRFKKAEVEARERQIKIE
jgi:HSP20 family protein